MPDMNRVDNLLLEWESAWRAGRSVTPEELCPDSPAIQAELRRRAELLRKFEAFSTGDTITGAYTAAEVPPAIPGYAIRGVLGRGGMGVVYRAWQEDLNREVAVKVLKGGPNVPEDLARRFTQEARLLARLKHDHLVAVYEAELHLGRPYFVMELVHGGNLAEALQRFAGDPARAAALMERVARVVHYAHEQGVLHRDLKPANILLDEQGRPHVSDFGLAKLFGEGSEETVIEGQPADERGPLSLTGALMGTPPYMAPEQFDGSRGPIGPRTDVWALGVILYELLTGRRPFAGDQPGGYSQAVCEQTPRPPRAVAPKLDRGLEAVVLKCLEKDPARRYATAAQVADELAALGRGEFPKVSRASRLRRFGHWAGRRRARLGAALLAPALLVAIFAVWAASHYLKDPERFRERVRRDFDAGRPVTFVRDVGPPLGYELGGLATDTSVSADANKEFTVSTHSSALVELWSPTPPAFRLRADVRHDHNAGDGYVGIYFDHRRLGPTRAWPSFYVVGFTDRGPNSTLRRGPNGEPGSRVDVAFHYFQPRAGLDSLDLYHTRTDGSLFFLPAPIAPDPGPWRTLDIRVTPQLIEAYWKNDLGKAERIARFEQPQFDQLAKMLPLVEPGLKDHAFNPAAGAAVGFYVRDSVAAFRNVVIEPVPLDP